MLLRSDRAVDGVFFPNWVEIEKFWWWDYGKGRASILTSPGSDKLVNFEGQLSPSCLWK